MNDYIPMNYSPDYIMHSGTRGMHWGIRLYQNLDGSLTALGKARRRMALGKKGKQAFDSKMKKAHEEEVENTKKKLAKMNGDKTEEKKASTPEETEARRKQLLNSTDANELYRNRQLLTTNEITERLNRINAEANLKSKADSQVQIQNKKTALDRLDKVNTIANKIADYSNTLKKFGIDVPKLVKQSYTDARSDVEHDWERGTTAKIRNKLNTSNDPKFLADNINRMNAAQLSAASSRIETIGKILKAANGEGGGKNKNNNNNADAVSKKDIEEIRNNMNELLKAIQRQSGYSDGE